MEYRQRLLEATRWNLLRGERARGKVGACSSSVQVLVMANIPKYLLLYSLRLRRENISSRCQQSNREQKARNCHNNLDFTDNVN